MIEELPLTLYNDLHPTGSNYICNPPVVNTDIDYVILTTCLPELKTWLYRNGWTLCGKDGYEDREDFQAFRLDEYNYIVVTDSKLFDKWVEATEKAKELNLLNKQDRITLFNTVFSTQ